MLKFPDILNQLTRHKFSSPSRETGTRPLQPFAMAATDVNLRFPVSCLSVIIPLQCRLLIRDS